MIQGERQLLLEQLLEALRLHLVIAEVTETFCDVVLAVESER